MVTGEYLGCGGIRAISPLLGPIELVVSAGASIRAPVRCTAELDRSLHQRLRGTLKQLAAFSEKLLIVIAK